MAEFKFYMFFVWVAAMALACWSVEVARMFARRMKKEALRQADPAERQAAENKLAKEYWPAVAVILPIKGVDADTAENLRALVSQEYPRCRLLFAVEAAEDPVIPLLEQIKADEIAQKTSPHIEIVIAGIATTRGQKIHNQLAAIDHTSAADELLVFMDADGRPGPHWLADLVTPLCEPQTDAKHPIGATTGFRFYVPTHPGKSLSDTMLSIINAAVAALLGPGWRNIAWGGSMAIRRRDFFDFGVHDAWQHALSDDYVLSWCVRKKAKQRIQFVQGCLVSSAADFSWPEFWEFAARQYKITRICAPMVWLTAIGAAALYLIALAYTLLFWLLSVVGIVPTNSLTGRVDHLLLLMFAALHIANMLRGWLLWQGGIAGLPEQAGNLRPLLFWYTLGYPASLLVNLLALCKSATGRIITWRGVRYTMKNRLETVVDRALESAPPAAPPVSTTALPPLSAPVSSPPSPRALDPDRALS